MAKDNVVDMVPTLVSGKLVKIRLAAYKTTTPDGRIAYDSNLLIQDLVCLAKVSDIEFMTLIDSISAMWPTIILPGKESKQ